VRWLTELIDTEHASNMTHLDDPDRPPRSTPAATTHDQAETSPSRRSTE
jgi:hypothetical protein